MKLFTNLIILCCATTMFAQQIEVSGYIRDSIGMPLESSNIVAFMANTKKLVSYSVANSEGKYKLNLKTNENYNVKVSFLGFTTKTIQLTIPKNSKKITKNFTLHEDQNQLDEVMISYEMPISVKGDSIIYNADSFKNGTEKKLGDVLKKLPGVEVNDDGEVEVEGKTVKKVMVEGKDFFDGDSKLAVENIPSNAIDKVQILKNFNEVSQLKGVTNNEDSFAINIKLKEGKKSFWFGDFTAGGGLDERYLANAKLFYYSPKTSINIIGNTNNLGEIPFTRHDYFKFTGGFRELGGSGTNLNITSDNLGFSQLQNNMANNIETKFGATNFSYAMRKSLDVSGYFIYSGTKTNMLQQNTKTYSTDGTTEKTTSTTTQNTNLGLAKLSALYKPHANFQLDYDTFFKVSQQTEDNTVNSNATNVSNTILESRNDQPFSINQNLNVYYTLNDKNIFSGEIQHLYSKEKPLYNATFLNLGSNPNTMALPFATIFPYNLSQNNYSLHQNKTTNTNKVDAKINYYNVLSKTSNLNVQVGTTVSNQKFNSSIFQTLDNGNINMFTDDEFGNDVSANFSDIYINTTYRFKTGKFTFVPAIGFHSYNFGNTQLNQKKENNQTKLLPSFYANVQFKKSESLRFTYNKTIEYPDVNSIAKGYVFNNYNSLFTGNIDIKNGVYDTFNINYSSFSLFNYTNVLAMISYAKKANAVKNNSLFVGINSVATLINSEVTDESLTAMLRWDKTLGKFKINLNANIDWLNNFNIVNDATINSKSLTQRYRASVLTNFTSAPNFEIGYQHSISNFSNSVNNNTFYTSQPFIKLETLLFKNTSLVSDYNYYNYSDTNKTLNTYAFLNAELTYQKENSKWEYLLGIKNILDTASINQNNYNEVFSTDSEYYVQPRYVYVTAKYNL